MTDKLFFNRQELAHSLGLSSRTVARLLSAGKLPRPIRLGRRLLWRAEDVRRWAAELPTEGRNFGADACGGYGHVAQR